ncbi:MAG: hypothetical protein ACLR4Z_11335 [Butyricicoccaceae bacterium]
MSSTRDEANRLILQERDRHLAHKLRMSGTTKVRAFRTEQDALCTVREVLEKVDRLRHPHKAEHG